MQVLKMNEGGGRTEDAIAAYKARVKQLEADGDRTPERTIALRSPGLHEAYLAQISAPEDVRTRQPTADETAALAQVAAYRDRIAELAAVGRVSPERDVALRDPDLHTAFLRGVATLERAGYVMFDNYQFIAPAAVRD